MLSYLRESQSDPLEQGGGGSVSPDSAGAESTDSMFLTVSGRDRSVRKSTSIVTALFVIASVALVVMAKKSHVQSAGASPAVDSQTQIEMAIGRVTGVSSEMTVQMDEIVQKFYEFSDVSQVEVNELNKNPFQLVAMPVGLTQEDTSESENKRTGLMLQRFETEKKALSLVCIMQSETGACCMINGMLLETGQRIQNFVVQAIEKDRVELVWQPGREIESLLTSPERTFILTLKE